MKSSHKDALKKGLSVAHKLATQALGSPDAMSLFSKLANNKDNALRNRLSALCDRYEKSLPDLRTGNLERALERECLVREVRLVIDGDALTPELG